MTEAPLRFGSKLLWLILALVLLFTFAVSLAVGRAYIGWADVFEQLFQSDSVLRNIIWELRVPRALLGLLVGASLGASGAAMQAMTHNGLAEPGLTGVSSGAALGAALVLYSGLALKIPFALAAGGMVGAFVSLIAVYFSSGQMSTTERLILAGLVVSSTCGALISLVLNLSPNPLATIEITFWLLGSVADRGFVQLKWVSIPIALGMALLLSAGHSLRAWALGEEAAFSLGVRPKRLRAKIALGTALAVGAATSVSGIIGFVGLAAPHLVRRFVRYDAARLLPASAVAGALLLSWADIAARLASRISESGELKLGVVTALLGAPFLGFLTLRGRGR